MLKIDNNQMAKRLYKPAILLTLIAFLFSYGEQLRISMKKDKSPSLFHCNIQKANRSDMIYPVIFHFSYTGSSPRKILTWQTPFEGWWGDFLIVQQGGTVLEYQGPIAKRLEPTQNDYITFAPNQTKTVTVDLGLPYTINDNKSVMIRYHNHLLHENALKAECEFTLMGSEN